ASRDPRLAPVLARADLTLTAFPTPSFPPDHPRSGHRCVTLSVGPEGGRGMEEEVTVDLSAQDIVPPDELRDSPRVAQSARQSDITQQVSTPLPRAHILDQPR